MIFGKLLNGYQLNGGALKPAVANAPGQPDSLAGYEQDQGGARLEITNVWRGPIIILTSESQAELEKHYLTYNSKIPSESFDAIFRDQRLDEY